MSSPTPFDIGLHKPITSTSTSEVKDSFSYETGECIEPYLFIPPGRLSDEYKDCSSLYKDGERRESSDSNSCLTVTVPIWRSWSAPEVLFLTEEYSYDFGITTPSTLGIDIDSSGSDNSVENTDVTRRS